MQALAVIRLQEGAAGLLVMPRLISGAGLHGRQDTHQSRMLAATRQHCLYPVLFADVTLAKKLDLAAAVDRQTFGVLAQLVAERLREFPIIEDPYLALV